MDARTEAYVKEMRATFTHLTGPRKGECDRFDAERVTIGRAPDNLLVFADQERRVSSHHAEIRREGNRFILRDLGSTNGTMINGRRVKSSEVHADELIEFGAGGPLVRFSIEYDEPSAAPGERPGAGSDERRPSPEMVAPGAATAAANHARANNLWLLIALVAAMLLGAAAGVILSMRRGPNFIEIARQNSPAVVFIRAQYTILDSGGQAVVTDSRTGTGFVVSSDGLIVTNRHLIRDWEYNPTFARANGRTDRVEVIFPGSRREDVIQAHVYRLSPDTQTDIAILKIDPPENLPVVRSILRDGEPVSQGAEVAVLGYPLGLDLLSLTGETLIAPSLSVGVVSRVNPGTIQLSLRAYNGNSGGPVFDHLGRVIGVLTANVRSAQDLTLCTPIEYATDLIRDGSQR